MRSTELPNPPLLVIGDRRLAPGGLVAALEGALAGGCRWIMVREKDLDRAALTALAAKVTALARPWRAVVSVNGDADAALAAGAQAVHLPQGGSLAEVRRIMGPRALIGVSTHSAEEAAAAARDGADYVTLSPIFATATKPGYGPALGTAVLGAIAQFLPIPVVALGGISAVNAQDCIASGARAIAVMGAVLRAARPDHAVRALVAALADRP